MNSRTVSRSSKCWLEDANASLLRCRVTVLTAQDGILVPRSKSAPDTNAVSPFVPFTPIRTQASHFGASQNMSASDIAMLYKVSLLRMRTMGVG